MATPPLAGGFLLPSALPSPPLSSTAGSSVGSGVLPTPRTQPLKFGSPKETAFINHVDSGISRINRRFAKRNTASPDDESTELRGYETFREAARDIDRLVDIVWVSGTPSLQISYLLTLALLVLSFMPSFPPHPRAMFRLLEKLDVAFVSLIKGTDIDSGARLPGFEGGRGVSATEKVRIKSLVERTRVAVVEVMGRGDFEPPTTDEENSEQETSDDAGESDSGHLNDFDMDVARVYDRTLVELGDSLEGPQIGIPER